MDRNILLIKRYNSGDKGALDELVKENEKLVWSIVKRMPSGDKEDLFQTGCIGLIKAVKRFDLTKGVMFSTYAVYMIIGEIKKFLRDDGMVKVSRGLKELAVKAKQAANEIELETGAPATPKEIAIKLGKKEEEIIESLEASQSTVSTNVKIGDGETEFEETISADNTFEEMIANNLSLAKATEKLSSKEKYIILMRYYKNKTQTEIAQRLGVSQVHISRLEKKIIETLRKEIV